MYSMVYLNGLLDQVFPAVLPKLCSGIGRNISAGKAYMT